MMREMSYRDKMILLIITVMIIIAVGVFALIKPKYETMVADRVIYEDTKTEWEGIDTKLQQIPVLQENIKKQADEAKATAQMFVNAAFMENEAQTFDSTKSNLILDQYIQPAIDESELKVARFAVEGASASALSYYYATPDVLTYSLLESADVNGNYATEVAELLKVSNTLSAKETVEVMTNTISMEVVGKKENLMTFLTKITEDTNAVHVTEVQIDDYTFGEGQTQTITEDQTDAEGNVTQVTREVPVASNGQGESTMTIALTFYNAMPIDEPALGE